MVVCPLVYPDGGDDAPPGIVTFTQAGDGQAIDCDDASGTTAKARAPAQSAVTIRLTKSVLDEPSATKPLGDRVSRKVSSTGAESRLK